MEEKVMTILDTTLHTPAGTAEIQLHHAQWLAARYAEHPPTRLALLPGETPDGAEPVYVDEVFREAAVSVRGAYVAPVKRGPGRPRKHAVK